MLTSFSPSSCPASCSFPTQTTTAKYTYIQGFLSFLLYTHHIATEMSSLTHKRRYIYTRSTTINMTIDYKEIDWKMRVCYCIRHELFGVEGDRKGAGCSCFLGLALVLNQAKSPGGRCITQLIDWTEGVVPSFIASPLLQKSTAECCGKRKQKSTQCDHGGSQR